MNNLYKSFLVASTLLISLFSFSQIPILNSYPSAQAVLLLDFDGQSVNGSSWNTNGPIVCGPSNLNQTQITEIFNRVAEDYRPFNINITTDSTKYWGAPANKRMRIILTTTSDWYGRTGGVSYTNSFSWGDNTPAFVFTALLNYNTKNIAEAASHEAGHTLGLRHQSAYDTACVKTSDYNSGAGSGEIGWAPIMGVGYYKNYTLWHNGANPYGCANIQNDLDIITSDKNGFGYRADDYDSTFTNAFFQAFSNNEFSTNGIISTDTDKDMFQFKILGNGRFVLHATPYNVGSGDAGSDLDVQIKLYNAAQQLIGTYNPPDLLNAAIDTTLNAGSYYYSVSGSGNQFATDYASLGSYALQGTFTEASFSLSQVKLNGLVEHFKHKLSWLIDAQEITKQSLEVSSDGKSFHPVTGLTANDRSFDYQPTSTEVLQYRLNVTFTNGQQYYSNIITLQDNINSNPNLLSNLIHNNTVIVKSPSAYNYSVSDYTGKVIAQGRLIQGINTINTNVLSNGMYVIKYINKEQQYAEKFVKQ